MKLILVIISLTIVQNFVMGQNSLFKGNNKLYPANLLVNYAVNFARPDDLADSVISDDTLSKFDLYIEYPGELVIKRTISGKTNVFLANNNDALFPYSLMEIRKKASLEDISILLGEKTKVPQEPDGPMEKFFNLSEIKGFEFIEEWEWNTSDIFTKKVIAINPIRIYNDFDRVIYRRTFYIIDTCFSKPCNKKNDIPVLLARARYEFFIDKEWCEKNNLEYAQTSMPFIYNTSSWNKSTQSLMIQQICNRVIKGEKEVYDFKDGHQLSHEQAIIRLGIITDSVDVQDLETGNIKKAAIQREFDPSKIKSVLFFEDWYINSENLLITKKVTAIAPVWYPNSENDDEPMKKKIPFVIKLSQDD